MTIEEVNPHSREAFIINKIKARRGDVDALTDADWLAQANLPADYYHWDPATEAFPELEAIAPLAPEGSEPVQAPADETPAPKDDSKVAETDASAPAVETPAKAEGK